MRSRAARVALGCGISACVTACIWAVAAAWYVGSEQTVYWWDYLMWWNLTVKLMVEMFTAPAQAVESVRRSLESSEYPLLPAIPLAAWCAAAGATRLPFVVGITTIYGAAAAAGLAYVCRAVLRENDPAGSPGSGVAVAAVPAVVFTLWSLPFVVAMRGFVDVGAVAISYAILGLFLLAPQGRWNVGRSAAVGALLAVLFIFRRYWAFWVTSFALVVTIDALWQAWQMRSDSGRRWLRALAAPVVIGVASAATAAVVAWPIVVRALSTPYADLYSAYQMPATSGIFAEATRSMTDLLAANGVLATCAGLAALGMLVARRETRRVGVMLAAVALCSYVQFRRVQGAGHHHHLLWSSLLTASTALAAASLAAQLRPQRAWGLVAALVVAGSLQWAAAVVPAASGLRFLMCGSGAELPLVRRDLAELARLVAAIDRVAAEMDGRPSIYCLASSAVLNSNILYAYPPSLHRPFHAAMLVRNTVNIDKRDGFPSELVSADLVVVCDPPQVHQGVENQQVIVEPARQLLEGDGFGAAFERLPDEFMLEGGTKTYLYVRTRPIEPADVAALSAALRRHYPDRPFVYEYRPQ
jgi:hypothetical protein